MRHLQICIKIPGEKENFKNFETTPGWASKTTPRGSGPSGGPLGVVLASISKIYVETIYCGHFLKNEGKNFVGDFSDFI